MKIHLTKIISITAAFCISLSAQAQQKTTVREMMEEVSGHFDVRFIYDSSLSLDSPYEGRPLRFRSLEKSLESLFSGTGIEWTIEDNGHIVLNAPRKPVQIAAAAELKEMSDTLDASRVISDRHTQKVRSARTGLEKLDGKAFNKGFAVLSSPDVIKTLQTLPGVASGTELLSGMYVHGGIGSDNLFLLDGVPLYQVSHLAGLFSSFNTDIIDNVDFYKSGFPARYGSRMSSIVDVSTKDGDMQEYHGLFSIGLLDGRLQFEGPIVKGRTSFNVAMRRSWIDVLSVPALAIVNGTMRDKTRLHYAFGDFNAKVTHLFAPDNKLTAAFYYGKDSFNFGFDYVGQYKDGELIPGGEDLTDSDGIELKWGNILASLRWQNRLTDQLTSDINAYYTQFSTGTEYHSYWWEHQGEERFTLEGAKENGRSGISDIALKAGFRWQPSPVHDVRFGAAYEHHLYKGRRMHEEMVAQEEGKGEVLEKRDSISSVSDEISVYAEDDISFGEKLKANLGLRYVIFATDGKAYHRLEPRVTLSWMFHRKASAKLSYTEMNQYAHNLTTSNVDLPTSIWLPSTKDIEPLHSKQVAAGIYNTLPAGFSLDVEGWFKTMDHIRDYSGHSMLFPPFSMWEEFYPEGRGISYGAELALGYSTEKTDISLAYTLSWTKRRFDNLQADWFLNWNDNRHKLTISAVHKFSERFEIYGSWNFRSGNRISVPSYELDNYFDYPFKGYPTLMGAPYNVQIPPYHRLDIGMNFRKTTKRGNESIWNLSLYNVYCRMNPMLAEIRTEKNGTAYGVATGVIPIIPSFSYTLKF